MDKHACVFVIDDDPLVRDALKALFEAADLDVEAFASIPIMFLNRNADVSSIAKAMREGAVDFLVHPLDDAEVLMAVSRALTRAVDARRRQQEQAESGDRVARLTTRERQVVDLVARGLLNKQIAHTLGISEETVKVHRGHAMRKLEVDSVPSLVRLLDRATS